MAFGNLDANPDLESCFGPLTSLDRERLLARLKAVDARLRDLAHLASSHVGITYEPLGLNVQGRSGLHGGPSGDAGDLWFDVSPAQAGAAGPPWVIESAIIVFCSDYPEPRGSSSTHDLLRLEATADTPDGVVDVLESHLAAITAEVTRIPASRFTRSTHQQLSERS